MKTLKYIKFSTDDMLRVSDGKFLLAHLFVAHKQHYNHSMILIFLVGQTIKQSK